MEGALVLLWLLLGLLLALALGWVIWAIYHYSTGGGGGFQPPPCSQDLSGLPDITPTPCCYVNGDNSTWRYDPNLDMVLAPTPSYYLNVCIGFCPTGQFNATTKTCDTSDRTAKAAFDKCVAELAPKQCRGSAMPVALAGATPYYGYQAGRANCQLCCPCGVQGCIPTACPGT